jgi:hypothetical protein
MVPNKSEHGIPIPSSVTFNVSPVPNNLCPVAFLLVLNTIPKRYVFQIRNEYQARAIFIACL